MKFKQFISKLFDTKYLLSTYVAFSFIFIFKYRNLKAIDSSADLFLVLCYCFEDFVVIACLFLLLKLKNTFINIFLKVTVFFLTLFNIFFVSKMGFPITKSLLSQVGDFAFIQTSVNSPGVYRNIIILSSSVIIFIICLLLIEKLKKRLHLFTLVPLFFVMMSTSIGQFYVSLKPNYKKNILTSLFSTEKSISSILESKNFLQMKGMINQEKFNEKLNLPLNKNIVLIIVETLSTTAIKKDMNKIMPFLSHLKNKSLNFENHYTSWPFSSKSLYSLMCGQQNHPTGLIETKVYSMFKCNRWIEEYRNQGFKTFVSYTGDFNYDNTGNFLKSLGFEYSYDKTQMDGEYLQTNLSIDDMAMTDKFDTWLKGRDKFFATFITMNSHHPFWTPDKKQEFSEDKYLNAISYQDRFIKSIVQTLKKQNKLKNTIIIITGDHGKREGKYSNSFLNESMFKVPLIIYGTGLPSKTYSNYTNHSQIGSSILSFSSGNIKDNQLLKSKNSFVFFDTGTSVYSLLAEEKKLVYKDDLIYLATQEWPNEHSKTCDVSECPEYYSIFYKIFNKAKLIYED